MSGIDPLKLLFCKYNVAKRVRLLKDGEIWPEKSLPARLRRTRSVRLKREEGMGPEKWFCWK